MYPCLLRAEQRQTNQIGEADLIFCRKRIIGGKNETPYVCFWEGDKVVFPRIGIFCKNDKIEKPFLQFRAKASANRKPDGYGKGIAR